MRLNDSSKQLVGAVVFRDHGNVEFREVKYFATIYPGAGYGTHLMNALKRDAIDCNLFYIVLYASNTAIPFFSKQQFSNFPTEVYGLSKTVVLSRVEQYQRSTLMACDLIDLFPSSWKGRFIRMKVGDAVNVSHGIRHTRDEEGVVIETRGFNKVKVHYPKWTADSDEWIVTGAKRISLKHLQEEGGSPVSKTDDLFVGDEPSRIKRIRIV